jgi:hypothetical protein
MNLIDKCLVRYCEANKRLYVVFFVLMIFLLLLSIYLTCTYYLYDKSALFDDAFIYLHIARNAAYHGTWQYYPIVDRPALLASSPLQICVLTVATLFMKIVGLNAKSLVTAKIVFIVGGCINYLMFAFVWRRDVLKYIVIGIVYFYLAAVFDTIFQFEGGLIFLWLLSILLLLSDQYQHRIIELCILLPFGVLIRPDIALIVYSNVLINWYKKDVLSWQLMLKVCTSGFGIALLWVAISAAMHIYPIPVTWWAKAAIPHMFSENNLIQVMFQSLGSTIVWHNLLSHVYQAAIGAAIIFFAIILATLNSERRIAELSVVVALGILLAINLPANFKWYYENIAVLLIAYSLYIVLSLQHNKRQRLFTLIYLSCFLMLTATHYRVGRSLQWNFNGASRAQGYLYLASRVQPDGTYNLPNLGNVLIKGPEIGILAYLSGNKAWEWDSAGLAQTATQLGALDSPLRWFYPKSLWRGPDVDAMTIAHGRPLRVIDVWATNDRNIQAMKKKCAFIFDDGTVCANSYSTLAAKFPDETNQ